MVFVDHINSSSLSLLIKRFLETPKRAVSKQSCCLVSFFFFFNVFLWGFFLVPWKLQPHSCGCFQGNHIPLRNLPCLTLDTVRLHGNKGPVKYKILCQVKRSKDANLNFLVNFCSFQSLKAVRVACRLYAPCSVADKGFFKDFVRKILNQARCWLPRACPCFSIDPCG